MTSVFHVANYSHPSGPVHPPTQLCQHPQTNPDFVREPLCSPAESTASLGELKLLSADAGRPSQNTCTCTHTRVCPHEHTQACTHSLPHKLRLAPLQLLHQQSPLSTPER